MDETDPSCHAAMTCWVLRLYNLLQQSFSNCFSRNNLQMLTWARRLETGVVQSFHECQSLEEASIVLYRGGVLIITLATWHVTAAVSSSTFPSGSACPASPWTLPTVFTGMGWWHPWSCKQLTITMTDHDLFFTLTMTMTMTHCWIQLSVPTEGEV